MDYLNLKTPWPFSVSPQGHHGTLQFWWAENSLKETPSTTLSWTQSNRQMAGAPGKTLSFKIKLWRDNRKSRSWCRVLKLKVLKKMRDFSGSKYFKISKKQQQQTNNK